MGITLAGCGGDEREVPRGEQSIDVPAEAVRESLARDHYARPLGAAVRLEAVQDDPAYTTAFARTFTSLTTEDELKWAIVHPERGRFDFGPADALFELARATGKRVRAHPLVWDEQLPAWVSEGDWTRAELIDLMRTHVSRLGRRYRGRVAEWDVVNEPLAHDGTLEQHVFHQTIGPEYIALAFRAAHRADPEARLFLNEIGAEAPGAKSDALLSLASDLKRRGVPIDGVGLELHAELGGTPSERRLRSLMRAYERAGLDVALTEMDVTIPDDAPDDAARRQADAFAGAARACRAAPNCTGLTVWGVTDEWSWMGADAKPTLLAAPGRPKPALEAVQEALRR